MIREIFSLFLASYAESYRLRELYRVLTSRLGYLTIALSCLAMIVIMYNGWQMLGLPLGGGSLEGLRLRLVAWIGLSVMLVPFVFYAGMVLVYGVFGLILYALGKLTRQQAFALALRAKYPREWYLPVPER
jgi:hypothetical protein